MPKRLPVTFGFEYRPARHSAATVRACKNLYAAPLAEGSPAGVALYRHDGISPSLNVPSGGAIRGAMQFGDYLYVVCGTRLWSFDNSFAGTNLGAIPGTARVRMSQNATQLTIATGEGQAYYVTGPVAPILISDGDFPAVAWVEAFDQYTVYGRLDGLGWGISAVGDTTAYDPLDVASAESQPDRIVTGLRNGRELLLFGEKTIEPFYNSGGADFPFERSTDGIIDVGCAAKDTPFRLDNTVYWLCNDNGGFSVRRMNGRTPERVSNPDIDNLLEAAAQAAPGFGSNGLASCYAFGYTYLGHAFYVLDIPIFELTVVYDVAMNKWQTRSSDYTSTAWRVNTAVEAFNRLFLGDRLSGVLGILGTTVNTEYGFPIAWETICAPVQFEQRKLTHAKLELHLDSNPKATARTVSMAWSDNDGETWSNEYVRTTPTIESGRNRCTWTNLGSSVSRIYRFKGDGDTPIGLVRAFVDVEVGG